MNKAWDLRKAGISGAVFGPLVLMLNAFAHNGFAGAALFAVTVQTIGSMLGGAVLFVFWALVFRAFSRLL